MHVFDTSSSEYKKLNLVFESAFARVYLETNCIVIEAKESYIPIVNFKDLFKKVSDLVISSSICKLIFDKRKLMVFDQKSMEWYFTQWKDEMYEYGLAIHRKILPIDPVFRECVSLGREEIDKKFPQAKYHRMDIAYASNLQEAMEK